MIRKIAYKNSANAIVLVRILLVFAVIGLLNNDLAASRIAGLILLIVVALMDWADGFVAKKLNICSKVGGLLDTLGDRITENLLFVFFAYQSIVPLYVPLIFITRSFMADFIRTISYHHGLSTFEVNTSYWGNLFVASRFSRVLYLVMKIAIFVFASLVLILEAGPLTLPSKTSVFYRDLVLWLSGATVGFCLLRFYYLIYDSRKILKKEFLS